MASGGIDSNFFLEIENRGKYRKYSYDEIQKISILHNQVLTVRKNVINIQI
jgi:hypothetical protein